MENWQEHITISPGVRSGKPCIKGTRITVNDILGWLASDMSMDEILFDFPQLSKTDILAAISFVTRNEEITKYVFTE